MNRIITSILFICFSILHSGCSEPETQSDDPIATALEKLKERKNDDAFVIIEALPTENYVQFATYSDQSIFVDFPISTYEPEEDGFIGIVETEKVIRTSEIEGYRLTRFISEDEEIRLRKYLLKWQVDFEVHEEKGTTPSGKVANFFTSIEAGFDLAPNKRSEFVKGVFTEVFLLTNYELNIIEN
ncbi:hypothetical protein QEH59_18365 [Coraliomargarita sp. SDUM461004]|uniref:Uncharacterized protein n=1 Tax=Thalassobacterium sedimentorum TaxID=3041258 RepID=A0ABU1ANZ1_9BACT|nr:hypothetical protein [Coraliomargarita sp. SDUM461004]MDQ8196399.1 hypothetical protein [Coraliomargarita sp. SDUM461004]